MSKVDTFPPTQLKSPQPTFFTSDICQSNFYCTQWNSAWKVEQRHQWRLQNLLLFISTVIFVMCWQWLRQSHQVNTESPFPAIIPQFPIKMWFYIRRNTDSNLRTSEPFFAIFRNNELIFAPGSTNCTKWSQTVRNSISSCICQNNISFWTPSLGSSRVGGLSFDLWYMELICCLISH